MPRDVAVMSRSAGYLQNISIGQHRIQADEPVEAGGGAAGPNPYELLLAALRACTSINLRIYFIPKRWPLEDIRVPFMHAKIHSEDCLGSETQKELVCT